MYLSIKAINILFDEFNRNVTFKFALAAQIRVGLLDSLTIGYLSLFLKDEQSFQTQLARLNRSVALEFSNEIEEHIKSGEKSKPEIDQLWKELKLIFPYNFTKSPNITIRKDIKDLKPSDMYLILKESERSWFTDVYPLYQYYSKYTHFGGTSKTMMDFDPEYDFEKLVISSYYVIEGSRLAYHIMQVESNDISTLVDVRDKLTHIEPTFVTSNTNNSSSK